MRKQSECSSLKRKKEAELYPAYVQTSKITLRATVPISLRHAIYKSDKFNHILDNPAHFWTIIALSHEPASKYTNQKIVFSNG